MNATKHGVRARLPVLGGEDPEIFRQQVEGIVDSLAPRNALEVALAEQAALSLWKIERAERVEATRAAAEDLLPFLPEDRHVPFRAGRGEPLAILLRVQATAYGCRWLLERWDALRGALEQNGDWDIEEMITAAQLRGQRPLFMETAEWECLVREAQVKSNPALLEEGRRQLLDQLTQGLASDPADPTAALLQLVEQEAARLEALRESNRLREAIDRAELADRLAVDTTSEGERVRRYQLDCDRKLHRALQSLLKLRRDEGAAANPDVTDMPDLVEPVTPPIPLKDSRTQGLHAGDDGSDRTGTRWAGR